MVKMTFKVASDTLSCFVDMFLHFVELQITFCFTNIPFHFENQLQTLKLVSLSISSSWVLLTEAIMNVCSEKC